MAKGNPVKPVAGAAKPISGQSKKSNRLSFLKKSSNEHMLYDNKTYIIFGIGFLIILLGFALMAGGGSKDPNIFNAAEIYAARRITIAPIVVITGFMLIAYGTLRKPS